MTLQQRLETDLKQAMREGKALARDTLRMLLSELKAKAIDSGKDLPEDEAQAVLLRAVKTRQESVSQFESAGRTDLAAKEREEIAVVQAYLPQPFTEAEARAAITTVIAETGATSKKDLGTVMKAAMAAHKGRLDGKLAQRLLGELLA